MAKSRKQSGDGWSLLRAQDNTETADKISLSPTEQSPKVQSEKRTKGKEVTIISKLVLSKPDMKALSKALKNHCGCGGSIKNECIELQGNVVEKVRHWLANQNYRI